MTDKQELIDMADELDHMGNFGVSNRGKLFRAAEMLREVACVSGSEATSALRVCACGDCGHFYGHSRDCQNTPSALLAKSQKGAA